MDRKEFDEEISYIQKNYSRSDTTVQKYYLELVCRLLFDIKEHFDDGIETWTNK